MRITNRNNTLDGMVALKRENMHDIFFPIIQNKILGKQLFCFYNRYVFIHSSTQITKHIQ